MVQDRVANHSITEFYTKRSTMNELGVGGASLSSLQISVSSRTAWSTKLVLGQLGLQRNPVSITLQ